MPELTQPSAAPTPVADFDEQRWPINLLILALAGFVVGVLVTTTHDFNDPRILHNGWVRLGSALLMVGVLFWGVTALQGTMRRRIQLCVLLSLLVHLGLAIYLHDRYLVAVAAREQRLALQAVEERERYTVPDYHWKDAERETVQEEFEKPVETRLPEQQQPAMRPIQTEAPSPVRKPESVQPTASQTRPQVAELHRKELSAPRREEQVGGLTISRQLSQVRLPPNELIPRPSIRLVREQPPELQSPAPASPRQAALPEVRTPQEAPSTDAPLIAPSLTRPLRSEALPIPTREAPLAPARQGTAPAAPASAESPLQVAAVSERPIDLQSPDAAVQRQADTVVAATFLDEPAISSAVVPAGSAVDEPRRLDQTPTTAIPLPRASPARTVRQATPGELVAPTAALPAAEPLAGAAIPVSPPLQPQATAVARAVSAPTRMTSKDRPALATEAPVLLQAEALPTKPRRLAGSDERQPLAAQAGEAPLRRVSAAPGDLPGDAESGEPGPLARATDAQAEPAVPAEVGDPSRREGGLPVLIAAVDGPGGLDSDRAPLVGIPSRRSRPESEIVHAIPQRFVIQRSGGQWAPEGKTLEPPAAAFRQRQPALRSQLAKERGGSEGTERAVELGLSFLAQHQFPDGRWCLDRVPNNPEAEQPNFFAGEMNGDTAATGLSLLAFLGAGYTHLEDKHRDTVHRGLQWLIRNQQPNGQLFTRATDATQPARIYSHGIATIALCEAYGMTRDPGLREPAQRAIRYILDAQDPRHGGWRYTQPDNAPVWYRESDTSVSGWMVMALKSAQMAGLRVPEDSLRKVSQWLDEAQAQGGALYVYNPHAMLAPDQIRGRSPNRAMTAEGLLMRLYLGWSRDNPALMAGAEYLKANLPDLGTTEQPLRDSYYWYYATQVMFQMQGDYWTTWNDQLQAMLEPSQMTSGPLAGSWHPRYPQSDRWAHAGGRLYVTALNLLMLEVYYRHLPLFQTLAK